MTHYHYQKRLHELWEKAVKLYADGNEDANSYFDTTELAFLRDEIGLTAQEMFDYAEDWNSSEEPDFTTVAMVTDIRRAYFREVQGLQRSTHVVEPGDLPGRDLEAGGVVWLPRIIVKARAKLKGEMSPEFMYGCGGDRKFLKENDIHPAEFLRLVWFSEDNGGDQAIIEWVLERLRQGAIAS